MLFQDDLYTFALSLADTAAGISRRYFRNDMSIDKKSGNSPVTKADLEIEATLRAMIRNKYPSHTIVGEEYAIEIGSSREAYAWVIDPIDGTVAFATGKPTFTSLIALTKNNEPVLGIIDQPITRERFIGLDGHAAYRLDIKDMNEANKDSNDWHQIIKTSQVRELSDARLSATTPDMFDADELTKFNQLKKKVKICSWGGDAYSYAMLASGHIDLIMEANLKYYDVAAVMPVITASGGIITTWQGDPITPEFNGQCLASSNKKLHNLALKIINSKTIKKNEK